MKKDLIRSCNDASEETEVLPVADRVVAMAELHPFRVLTARFFALKQV
jgi:hypothetical protein